MKDFSQFRAHQAIATGLDPVEFLCPPEPVGEHGNEAYPPEEVSH
jgi:hypothetical protein